jgi:hypothetical protein
MGVYCQICAVSFDIARYRTRCEPEDNAWRYRAPGERENYLDRVENSFCFPKFSKSGCETIFPSPNDGEGMEWHLAGPGCCATGGYNGHRISSLEMKVYRTIIFNLLFLFITTNGKHSLMWRLF